MTGILGTLAEAWDEVRVHKTRVLLSLVGVFLAVFAMTSVTALGLMVAQVQQEVGERSGGRAATVAVSAYDPATGMPPDGAEWDAAVADLVERYDIATAATIAWGETRFRMPGGTMAVQTRRVSPGCGALPRIQPDEGRWLRDGHRQDVSPSVVVTDAFLSARAVSGLSSRPTAVDPVTAMYAGPSTLELWVPADQTDQVMETVRHDLALALPGVQVDTYRSDPQGLEETISVLRLAIRGAGAVVLVLGGLGVLNIGLVTVRQRIREIGVRRSFGATSGRIFAAVMLESVCATALAGLLAVGAAIVLVRNLPLEQLLNDGIPIADLPGFPVAAAVEGMIAATAVGALAGLLPAIIAVRAKVIDAIRF